MTFVVGLLIAALGGAAVGLERQRSGHSTGPRAAFGGIRTFTLLGVLGGISGGLLASGSALIAAIVLSASAALVVVAYAAKSTKDIDATTEVAAIVVLAAGVLAATGRLALASGIVAATTVLLFEKTRLHAMVGAINDVALEASVRFAALALVVLPLLPQGAYGPFGAVRPREVWLLVLFFSGLSFAAWVARRMLGPTHGVLAAGVLGGLISSTSVTLTFARASRQDGNRFALAIGTVGACTVMLVRVAVASAVLNPAVARAFIPFAWAPLLVGVFAVGVSVWRVRDSARDKTLEEGSPLQLWPALQMAALFQVVLIIVSAVVAWWSIRALMLTSAMIGLTDLDALTLSLARNASLDPGGAARALAVGVLSNTLLKATVAAVVGRGMYRQTVSIVLGLMAISLAVSLSL